VGQATLADSTVLLPHVYGALRLDPAVLGAESVASALIALDAHTYKGSPPRQWIGEPAYDPTAQVPFSVTPRQARLALLGAGLLPAVEAAIDRLPEPQKTAAKITWEFSTEVQRNNGLIPQMATALGMTKAQIDQLFIAAKGL
jgi:hypothetical protein